jgi:putative oxidoreductase
VNIVAIVVQVLLGLAFFYSGVRKLLKDKPSLERRDHLKVAPWFWVTTGIIEIAAALGIVAGIWVQWVSVVAAAVLGATMLGAMYTHLFRGKDPIQHAIAPAILGLMALLVLLVHWSDFAHLFG